MYLDGVGIEVMANSDNVLRGGLTTKPVDVASLIEVVDPSPITPEIQRPALVDGIATYASPVPEFSLQRIELDGTAVLDGGPAIVLCLDGRVEGPDLVLDRGGAAWMPAADGPVALHGAATLYRAGLGRLA
jgi:mannose-6-phosphate isomerase